MSFSIKIFAFVFTTFLFYNNCIAQSFAKKIIGRWKFVKFEAVQGGKKLDSLLVNKNLNSTITFKDDGTFSTAQLLNEEYKILGTGNYKISDDGKYLYQDDDKVNILTFRDKDFAIQVKDVLIMHLSKMIYFTLPKENLKVSLSKTITDVNFSPLPNVTLHLQSSKQFFQTNSKGFFKLDAFLKDSIFISSVGYKSKTLLVNDLIGMEEIILDEERKDLQEVVVSNAKKESIVLNDFSNCGLNWHINSALSPHYQMAQKFSSNIHNALLKSIRICKMHGSTTFRVKILDIDTLSFLPGKNLLDSFIEISTAKRNVKLNLEKYNLRLPHRTFFVAIEWLFIDENKYSEKQKINGVKEKRYYYTPDVSTRNWNVKDGDNQLLFLHNYSKDSIKLEWSIFSRTVALISAEITQ